MRAPPKKEFGDNQYTRDAIASLEEAKASKQGKQGLEIRFTAINEPSADADATDDERRGLGSHS